MIIKELPSDTHCHSEIDNQMSNNLAYRVHPFYFSLTIVIMNLKQSIEN